MATTFTLNSAVEVAPAIQAITTTEFTILAVQENYGIGDGTGPGGFGRFGSVEVEVLLNADHNINRRIVAWEGDEYLAVRGTWTDDTLGARVAQILLGQ